MIWYTFPHNGIDVLGFIPSFLYEDDPRPAREQIEDRYVAGWSPFKGFRLGWNIDLLYEGDPPLSPTAWSRLRDELIIVYHCGWVAIIQSDGTFEVSRCD